jgi:hypothetical protein
MRTRVTVGCPSIACARELTSPCRPQDFRVGGVISVHGRDFLLFDCDAFTREWYQVRGRGCAAGAVAHTH